MSLWQFVAAADGYRRAHCSTGPEAPTPEEFDEMLASHEAMLERKSECH